MENKIIEKLIQNNLIDPSKSEDIKKCIKECLGNHDLTRIFQKTNYALEYKISFYQNPEFEDNEFYLSLIEYFNSEFFTDEIKKQLFEKLYFYENKNFIVKVFKVFQSDLTNNEDFCKILAFLLTWDYLVDTPEIINKMNVYNQVAWNFPLTLMDFEEMKNLGFLNIVFRKSLENVNIETLTEYANISEDHIIFLNDKESWNEWGEYVNNSKRENTECEYNSGPWLIKRMYDAKKVLMLEDPLNSVNIRKFLLNYYKEVVNDLLKERKSAAIRTSDTMEIEEDGISQDFKRNKLDNL